ncbi:MAG: DUF4198 domain-containing protein [Bacteroidia bacterium]|nr:DUF4198 domain-containing protein [Bacteroidia bacterium]
MEEKKTAKIFESLIVRQKAHRIIKKILLIILIISFHLTSSFAHDLWIIADNYYPAVGEKVVVKVMFGHNFPDYNILIPKEALSEFYYIAPDGQKKEISKTWEEKKEEKNGYLAGEITIEQEGTYLICAARKVVGEEVCVPSEKYAKAIVIAGKGNKTVSQMINQRIEIIPLKNPSEIKIDDILPVKILYEGKPLSTYIYAAYSGYCSNEEPFYITAKSDEDGAASIKISKSFLWFVTVNFKRDFSTSITFEIK